MSLEMEIRMSSFLTPLEFGPNSKLLFFTAKVLWLKNHMPREAFEQSMFFDLPDFLTYLATGDLARSNCSLACKCSYVPPGVEGSKGWNDDFFKAIGLEELVRHSAGLCYGLFLRPVSS
jgi:ribulose kinase